MSAVLTRHHVKVIGRGKKPMLLAHGYGCDQNVWRFITPAFEDRYKIILFDHVGHGQSDAAAFDSVRYGSLNGYSEDVPAICRELDLKNVIFVGHSVSAMIGALAAIHEPERFDRLVRPVCAGVALRHRHRDGQGHHGEGV
ncbi:alpha/beta fold hydrolase [Microvirga sp. TS319]|uniref:alpha/beta fold hydrolase n=1 Tax=Microvirga sp. TS319 TaxID=3241165 RepID=UPI00351A0D0E